ncbi:MULTISPECIES: ExbD/TolR family protein [Comamonas]|jgi:biopolymer transport protein TolR|uniref:ExbD/TolR family protein n=2 Tax=Comamonas TaxID=283 RepID=A0ABV4AYK0_9BURK|nr:MULTISPECIES: ExbD/TolR family protein [Comamonas]MCD2164229.1 ExbD/TolR family protein [Comamonas koreensis]TDS74062.1 cell division and transport-associated protein TolR [Comamonas sp. JUb58]ULR90155.1 ExbD/TolR family protein [Comamonas sp. B21-038]
MPAVASRGKRNRRTVNEINMVPFIDVMLVLLIIFMVTAPMLTPGAINLPKAGKSERPPTKNIAHVLLDKDGSIQLKTGNVTQTVAAGDLADRAKAWQADNPPEDSAMLIVADKDLTYQKVIDTMSTLQKAGVKRVALQVAGGSQ